MSKIFVISVPQARRRIATSWRPACSTTSTAGSASSRGQRANVEAPERVDQNDLRLLGLGGGQDRYLDEAEERAVAALGHEFGVDAKSSVGRAGSGRLGHIG